MRRLTRWLSGAAVALSLVSTVLAAENPGELAAIAGWRGAAPSSSRAFSFVVLSDRTGNHLGDEWAQAVSEVNLLKPDLVMFVGDLIEGRSPDEKVLTREWEEVEAIVRRLDAPFFYCAGNHDINRGNYEGENVSRKVYLARHGVAGKSYYSFDYRSSHFIVLDSGTCIEQPEMIQEQVEWLKQDLAAAQAAEHFFVFYHHPASAKEKLGEAVNGLLPAGKTTIFNGHTHRLDLRGDADRPVYVLASSGVKMPEDAEARLRGQYRMYARVAVDGPRVSVALIPLHQIESIQQVMSARAQAATRPSQSRPATAPAMP